MSESQSNSWILACLICLVANSISNFGLNLQKLSHLKKKEKKQHKKLWICGFLCVVAGSFGDFAALGFGSQSIVAPLGATTLVTNILIAPMFLKEKLMLRDVLSTLVIVSGCVIAVMFASHKNSLHTLEQLYSLYERKQFAVYFSVLVVILIVWLLIIRRIEYIQKRHGGDSPQYKSWEKFHRFSYPSISGIVGAQSVLFAKTVVEMVMDTINGGNVFFFRIQSYPILILLGLCITLQVYWLNCGLARFDALYNVPIFQSFWISFSVIGGGIHYGEFSDFSTKQIAMFPLGVVLTIVGVYFLSQRDTNIQKLLEDEDSKEFERLLDLKSQRKVKFEGKLGLALKLEVIPVLVKGVIQTVKAWRVENFVQVGLKQSSAEGTGLVHIDDLITAINGEWVMSRNFGHRKCYEMLMGLKSPLEVTFCSTKPSSMLTLEDDIADIDTCSSSSESEPDQVTITLPTDESLKTPLLLESESAYQRIEQPKIKRIRPRLVRSGTQPEINIRGGSRALSGISLSAMALAQNSLNTIHPQAFNKTVFEASDNPFVSIIDSVLPFEGKQWAFVDKLLGNSVSQEEKRSFIKERWSGQFDDLLSLPHDSLTVLV
eukprot:TRINITY_DN603_c0_g1_i10.p1 TRINITY_DN603_c0_g1~~TRINITY_DN603_c0_g1_i10.p1  ORF type:complete len:602 (+),score=120.78 TRINITY_DN603_c0_g1_i10:160-1965(+)